MASNLTKYQHAQSLACKFKTSVLNLTLNMDVDSCPQNNTPQIVDPRAADPSIWEAEPFPGISQTTILLHHGKTQCTAFSSFIKSQFHFILRYTSFV
jgi:hypothetical protein